VYLSTIHKAGELQEEQPDRLIYRSFLSLTHQLTTLL